MKMRGKITADKLLLIGWKKLLLIVLAWIVSVVAHNAIFAIFGVDEAIFFILAVIIIPLYFLISVGYSLIKLIMKNSSKTKQKIDAVKFGIAGGIIGAVYVLSSSIFYLNFRYAPLNYAFLYEIYNFAGFNPTFMGAVLGTIYGFIDGFILLFVLAWLYNKL